MGGGECSLDWAAKGIAATDRSAENVVTVVNDDLAYTVDLEHMTRHIGDRAEAHHPTRTTSKDVRAPGPATKPNRP